MWVNVTIPSLYSNTCWSCNLTSNGGVSGPRKLLTEESLPAARTSLITTLTLSRIVGSCRAPDWPGKSTYSEINTTWSFGVRGSNYTTHCRSLEEASLSCTRQSLQCACAVAQRVYSGTCHLPGWSGCSINCWAVTTTSQILEAGRPRLQEKGVPVSEWFRDPDPYPRIPSDMGARSPTFLVILGLPGGPTALEVGTLCIVMWEVWGPCVVMCADYTESCMGAHRVSLIAHAWSTELLAIWV